MIITIVLHYCNKNTMFSEEVLSSPTSLEVQPLVNGTIEDYVNYYCNINKNCLVCVDIEKKIYYKYDYETNIWRNLSHVQMNVDLFIIFRKTAMYNTDNFVKQIEKDNTDNVEASGNSTNRIKQLCQVQNLEYNPIFENEESVNKANELLANKLYVEGFRERLNQKNMLPLARGNLDFETGKLVHRCKEDYFSYVSNIDDYLFEIQISPFVKNYVRDLMDNNMEMVNYFQKLMGHSVMNSKKEKTFIFFKGSSENNTTFILAMKYIFGNSVAIWPKEEHLLANTVRVWFVEEMNFDKLDEGMTRSKDTPNDNIVNIMTVNSISLNKMSEENKTKIVVIPFNTKHEHDPLFKEELYHRNNIASLMHWITDGAKKYMEEGLGEMPKEIMEATASIFN